MAIKIETIRGYSAKLFHDPHGADESPREYECSTFFGFHRRVLSPDPAPDSDPIRARAIAEGAENICLPVYMYDHGGRVYKASADGNPFHCPWDSGLFGFIYISRADAREMYAISRITESYRNKILADLAAQVDVYSQWANGETYRWEVTAPDGETVESCGGYYDTDSAWADALECRNQELATDAQLRADFAAHVPIQTGPDGNPIHVPFEFKTAF